MRARHILVPLAAFAMFATITATGRAAPATPAPSTANVVVDGARYTPEQAHRFDGRTLYFVVDVNDKSGDVIAFTKRSDFDAVVTKKENAMKNSVKLAGQYGYFFEGDDYQGNVLNVGSGTGYNDLRAVSRGCGIFGCAGNWNDVISSIEVLGALTLNTDTKYGGDWLWFGGGYGRMNLAGAYVRFNNTGSSLNVWWD